MDFESSLNVSSSPLIHLLVAACSKLNGEKGKESKITNLIKIERLFKSHNPFEVCTLAAILNLGASSKCFSKPKGRLF